MTYKFRYKRLFFYTTRAVAGHRHDESQDKMVLYFADGGLEEIPAWRRCAVKLGPDWVLAVKKDMEAKAGQSIPVSTVG